MTVGIYRLAEAALGRRLAWRIGRLLYMGSRRELQNDPDVNGEYELQRAWIRARAADARPINVVDVGANIGNWTARFFAELSLMPSIPAHIWAFEPASDQRKAMASRLEPYISDGRLRIDQRALGSLEGRATFVITGSETGTSAIDPSGTPSHGIDVEVTTLDVVFSDVPSLDFIKVDTEGNDFNVILGARNLFDAERISILQFEYNWRWVAFRYFLKDVFDFAAGRPYRIGRVTPAGLELYATWHQELERFIETNYVLVHNEILRTLPSWEVKFDDANVPVSQSTGKRRLS